MTTEATKNSPKNNKEYNCEYCNYICFKKSDLDKHFSTGKHKKGEFSNKLSTEATKKSPEFFSCKFCNKIYKDRSGLWRHNKKCKEEIIEPTNDLLPKNDLLEIIDDKESEKILIYKLLQQNMELVTQNQEFKQMMLEQNKQTGELQKQMIEIAKDTKSMTINNTNTTNNKFNMNIFLNEKCKDALNIMDFVTSLP